MLGVDLSDFWTCITVPTTLVLFCYLFQIHRYKTPNQHAWSSLYPCEPVPKTLKDFFSEKFTVKHPLKIKLSPESSLKIKLHRFWCGLQSPATFYYWNKNFWYYMNHLARFPCTFGNDIFTIANTATPRQRKNGKVNRCWSLIGKWNPHLLNTLVWAFNVQIFMDNLCVVLSTFD